MDPNETLERIKGLSKLVAEAVDHGSRAVERVHRESAKRPFEMLKIISPIAGVVRAVESVHDAVVTTSYDGVRTITRAVADAIAGAATPGANERPSDEPAESAPAT